MNIKHRIKFLGMLLIFAALLVGGSCINHDNQVHAANAYDISQWQGRIDGHKAHRLKHEVNFVILRAQNGASQQDLQYSHDQAEMNQHHIPYGVYSYSLYRNSPMARQEAQNLYNRAPQAQFYVNDIEINHAKHRIGSATKAWANEMRQLTTKPIVLYSYANFIQQHLLNAKKAYNATWVASYSNQPPKTDYHYDLWQYTDAHYSHALKRKVDASVLTGQPLSFWTGQNSATALNLDSIQPQSSVNHHAKNQKHRASHHHYVRELKRARRNLRRGRRLTRAQRHALRKYARRHSLVK